MFQMLINWMAAQWSEFWRVVKDFLTGYWAVMTAVVAGLIWFVDQINAAIVAVVATLDAIIMPTGTSYAAPGSISAICNMANTLFPLDVLMLGIVGWGVLIIALSVYRLVKSWIPTLS